MMRGLRLVLNNPVVNPGFRRKPRPDDEGIATYSQLRFRRQFPEGNRDPMMRGLRQCIPVFVSAFDLPKETETR